MSRLSNTLVLTIVVASLAIVSGCQLFDLTTGPNFGKKPGGKLVFFKTFCVEFAETRTTSSFASSVVIDQLEQDILAALNKKLRGDLGRIVDIRMSGGSVKLARRLSNKVHDWTITSSVEIARQDNPSGPVTEGPATLVNESTVNLKGLTKAVPVDLNSTGVNIVNGALEDLIAGGDPRLIVTMVGTSVDPEPSASDPLVFEWKACIDVLATLSP